MYADAMSRWEPEISSHLSRVLALQQAAESDPALARRVLAIKQYQHARFARDYEAMLHNPRYRRAIQFFLRELYGPVDFAARDAEFARIVPMLSRILPAGLMQAVAQLAELHALTETLDHQMARAHSPLVVDEPSYRAAWRSIDRPAERECQLDLLISIGTSLDRHARAPWLSAALRLMKGPARAAGFGRLQLFLESGLSSFASMAGADDFLATIATNERRVIASLSVSDQK